MKHQFYSLEKKIQNAMEELRFQIEAVIFEKGICIDGFESYTNDNLSIKIVISVCEELICQGYQLHSKWETVLSSIYFISNCFEEKIALNISLSDENKIIDDIWNFLYSIPTYYNN